MSETIPSAQENSPVRVTINIDLHGELTVTEGQIPSAVNMHELRVRAIELRSHGNTGAIFEIAADGTFSLQGVIRSGDTQPEQVNEALRVEAARLKATLRQAEGEILDPQMAKEVPSAEIVEAAIQKAAVLKRADPDKVPAGREKMPVQFGNNFYLLFKARKFRGSRPNAGAIVKIYLEPAEALGEPWQRFLTTNTQLLAELDEALAEEDIYASVWGLFRDFYTAGDFDGGDAFGKRFHPELSINVIGIPVWQRLNALLQQSAEAMKEVGIDPTQFYA